MGLLERPCGVFSTMEQWTPQENSLEKGKFENNNSRTPQTRPVRLRECVGGESRAAPSGYATDDTYTVLIMFENKIQFCFCLRGTVDNISNCQRPVSALHVSIHEVTKLTVLPISANWEVKSVTARS